MKAFLSLALVLAAATVPSARADDASHRAAAEDFLKAANADKTFDATIDQMLTMQLKANPKLEPAKPAMRRFFAQYLGYASLKDDLLKIYMAEFTEPELKQLAEFYRSPAGKKSIEKMPAIMAKSGEVGMKRVQDNQAELRQMIEAEMRKAP